MFCIDFPSFHHYKDQTVKYLQPKYDGHLAKIHKATSSIVLTKNDKDITTKAMNCESVKEILMALPKHTIAFGELHCPGVKATSVPTMLNEGSPDLQLSIFAAPLFGTRNLFNKPLEKVEQRFIDRGISFTSIIILKDKPDVPALLNCAVEDNFEGWVLKQAHMKGWYKLKPTKTVDAFVIGTTQSFSANHYGELEGIIVCVWKNERIIPIAQVGSGFTEQFRKIVDRKSLVDRVCEIKYDDIAANGKLKFPRFIRWREDKNKEDCIWEQLL